ncbi:MAG: enoyl-CoA hydratase-related protein, partial [SAR202 cluster bacterium]|nr:enoyl-CoA hydratase-related protein [SAR202 cluster bacterium]
MRRSLVYLLIVGAIMAMVFTLFSDTFGSSREVSVSEVIALTIGGDIDSMEGQTPQTGRTRMKVNHRLVRLLAESEKPVIAAVSGYAVGAGAGIAL